MQLALDLSGLIQRFDFSGSQIITLVDDVTTGISYAIFQDIQGRASNELRSSRLEYLKGLQFNKTGLFENEIALEGWLANAIEEGEGTFDMKPFLLNGPNASFSKNGIKFNTVPFRFSAGPSMSLPQLPKEVLSVVKKKPMVVKSRNFRQSRPITKNDIRSIANTRARGITGGQARSITSKAVQELKNYEGVIRQVDQSGKGTLKSFRRVSENSAPSSWIHPGLVARNYFSKSIDSIDIEKVTGPIIDNFIDQNFS